MNINNRWHVITFLVIFGGLSYLGKALWEAYYLPVIPLSEGWCLDAVEFEYYSGSNTGPRTEWRCVEFRSTLDYFIYLHNSDMRDRNKKAVFWMMAVGGLVGLLLFNTIPKRRKQIPSDDVENAITAIMIGVGTALVVPLLLSWPLPPPVEWLPQSIVEASQERVDRLMAELEIDAFLADKYGHLSFDELIQLVAENEDQILAEFEEWRKINQR